MTRVSKSEKTTIMTRVSSSKNNKITIAITYQTIFQQGKTMHFVFDLTNGKNIADRQQTKQNKTHRYLNYSKW